MTTKLLASSDTINSSIDQMAAAILANHPDQSPLFVALLRGAAPFASKLMFSIAHQSPNYHPEIDYMMISTYGTERTAGKPGIVTNLAPTTIIDDRTVIVLDDVLDKGITANFVMNYLRSRGAGEVKLAVLVTKQTERQHPIVPDYSCLESEDIWLAGMGMDDAGTANEAYRWASSIYKIK